MVSIKPEQVFEYPFSWLDHMVEMLFYTEADQVKNALNAWEETSADRVREEFGLIWRLLKQQRFRMLVKKRESALVLFYKEYLIKTREQLRLSVTLSRADTSRVLFTESILEELDALLQRMEHWYGPVSALETKYNIAPEAVNPSFKIICRLSVDQVAILLKAADEVRLLAARSFSLVLRTLVPFLSTERLQDFSWKSARSSTYKMEGTDKDIAIRALETMIAKIREYE